MPDVNLLFWQYVKKLQIGNSDVKLWLKMSSPGRSEVFFM